MKKTLSFITAFTIISGISMMTGCESSSNKSSSVKMEYGATMQVNKVDLPIPIEFDNRFLTDEEANAIVNYYYAVAEHDEELAKSASYPEYLEYLAEEYECDSIKDFLAMADSMIAEGFLDTTDDYEFSYINITSCYDESDTDVYTYFDDIDDILNTAITENGGEDITSKIESRKLVSADITCIIDGNEISLTDSAGEQQVYVYTIDGKVYVL